MNPHRESPASMRIEIARRHLRESAVRLEPDYILRQHLSIVLGVAFAAGTLLGAKPSTSRKLLHGIFQIIDLIDAR